MEVSPFQLVFQHRQAASQFIQMAITILDPGRIGLQHIQTAEHFFLDADQFFQLDQSLFGSLKTLAYCSAKYYLTK